MNAPEMNPFITKDVACPICLLPTRQSRVKRHLYLEQNLDPDWRARTYVFKVKGLENLYPHLYFMWHCPHCCFTASTQVFEDPTLNQAITLEQTRAAFVRATREEPEVDRVFALLSTGIAPGGPWDHQQAVRLHLLAIYVLRLMGKNAASLDYLNLARYYLRLAWLWREMDENPDLSRAFAPTLSRVVQALASFGPQVPATDRDAALLAVQTYQSLVDAPSFLEKGWEPGDIYLHMARILLQQRELVPARLNWAKAWDLAQRHEVARKDLESKVYRLRDQLRATEPSKSGALKAQMEEMSARLIKIENAGRNLRNKGNQVRDLLEDLAAELEPGTPGPEGDGKKPRRGLFG